MFCPYCGLELPGPAAFCPHCGSEQPAHAAHQEKDESTPAASFAAQSRPGYVSAGYAGFWKRFLAWILDYLLATTLSGIVAFVQGFVAELSGLDEGGPLQYVPLGIGVVVPWLYFALFQSSRHQATPGKMALGAVVTDLQGRRIGFLRATVRYFGKYLSALLLLLGFVLAGVTPRKRALHDYIAGTLVVNRAVPQLGVSGNV